MWFPTYRKPTHSNKYLHGPSNNVAPIICSEDTNTQNPTAYERGTQEIRYEHLEEDIVFEGIQCT